MNHFIQGDNAQLRNIHAEQVKQRKTISQSKMGAHVEVGLFPSHKVLELYEMLDMIVRKNLPIGITDDTDYRYVSDLGS